MEQDTMKAVRDAELAAEKIQKSALQEQGSILEAARLAALKTVDETIAAEKAKAAQNLNAARGQGDLLLKQAVEAVGQEIVALRQTAEGKRAQAKQLIHSALI